MIMPLLPFFGRKIQTALLGLILFASLTSGSIPVAQAQGSAPALFGDANETAADAAWDAPAFAARSRYVSVNTGLLVSKYSTMKDVQASPEITLNLFDDVNYTGVVTEVSKTGTGYTWSGNIKGIQNGYFYMLTYEDVYIAHIASTAGVYEVSNVGGDLYRAIQIDQSKLQDDIVVQPEYSANDFPPMDSTADVAASADSENTIDVMVMYTIAARRAEHGIGNMKARIALAIQEANKSYANAGVTSRLRLVHTHEVGYTESGSLSLDLDRLSNPGDGYMDVAHILRDTYAADLVTLVTNGGDACGAAYIMDPLPSAPVDFAPYAFSVVNRPGCMTGYYSFAHELGHNRGARHDIYVDNATTPFTYAHGYVHAVPADPWRTIMAYNNRCSDFGYACIRLNYWSNPNKTWNDAAMGNATAMDYQVLNDTDAIVANIRTTTIAGGFDSRFTRNSSGWTPVYGTWKIYSGKYKTFGVANNWSSAMHNGVYGDVTFESKMRRYGCTDCANKLIVRGDPSNLDPDKNWNSSYAFQYTNSGYFSVYRCNNNGSVTALKKWTYHPIILKSNWNILKVVAVGPSLKFYINGWLVWAGNSTSLATGNLGIAMYRKNAGAANALNVDWAKASTTPTSDVNPDEEIMPGIEIGGDNPNQSP
jgi:hypothetical protein